MCTVDALEDMGFQVVEAASAEEAIGAIDGGLTPNVMITDHLMPGMTGAELSHEETKDMAPVGGKRLAAILKEMIAGGA